MQSIRREQRGEVRHHDIGENGGRTWRTVLRELAQAPSTTSLGAAHVRAVILHCVPGPSSSFVAAALGLEPRQVLPVLEDFVRRILVNVRDASDVQAAFLRETEPRPRGNPASGA